MQVEQKTLNRAVLSSLIGATIEWYDFFLFGVVAGVVLNKLYFPSHDPAVSLMLAYATFAVGFVTRPLGGIVFGHFGDRIGRKSVLVATLIIMGVATFLVGLVPTYAQIGLWAPALLLTIRVFQGIGLGGEWGGSVLMAYEFAPEHKRGFYTSIPQMGLSIGILLASGSLALLSSTLSNADFMAWGWRICFLASFVLVLVGLWIRLRLVETPDFAGVKAHHQEVKLPIASVLKNDTRNVLLGLGARHIDGVFFNIFAVFAVSYLIGTVNVPRNSVLVALMVGAAALTVFIPLAGWLSDRVVRSRLFATAALISALSVFPAFYLMRNSGGSMAIIWLAIIIPYGFLYSAVYGNVAALQCDLFEPNVRYTGISFVYQTTSVIAGLTALICTVLVKLDHGEPWLVCWYVLLSGLLSYGCARLIGRTRAGRALPVPAR